MIAYEVQCQSPSIFTFLPIPSPPIASKVINCFLLSHASSFSLLDFLPPSFPFFLLSSPSFLSLSDLIHSDSLSEICFQWRAGKKRNIFSQIGLQLKIIISITDNSFNWSVECLVYKMSENNENMPIRIPQKPK